MMSANLLSIHGLKKKLGKFTLGPVDLHVERGLALALVGPNGSGKSTLLRLMMNLMRPEAGQVDIFGTRVSGDDPEIMQRIGYSGRLQEYKQLRIKELASWHRYWYHEWDEDRYRALLQRYGLDEREKYGDCSTGTQKKVDFILSIVHQPELLLLDEPSSGVDLLSQSKMKEDLIEYMESGERSIILASHVLDEIKSLCDTITVLDQGQVRVSFDKDDLHAHWARVWVSALPDELKHHPAVLSFNTAPNQLVTNQLPQLEQAIERYGVELTHIQRLELNEVLEYILHSP